MMGEDIPVWVWGLIGVGSALMIAWIIYSVIIVYQFSIRRRQVGGGRWFIVGLLMFILASAGLQPAHTISERIPFIGLIGLFAAGIILGAVRSEKTSAGATKPANVPTASSPSGPRAGNASARQASNKGSVQFESKYCFECGTLIRAKAEICPACGVRQPIEALSDGRSRLAAALFALFLGGLGIYKFYLGQVGWGITYLLFCWTFIPTIVGFIEGIVLLTRSEHDFAARYATPRGP
jgi:TM2 domain-containing membrane protein YozV